MNFYEIMLTFSYVMLCTGIISMGVHLTNKMEKREAEQRLKSMEVIMTNLENTVER